MLRTRDIALPPRYTPDELLAVFHEQIAVRSMVRIADAERLIAAWEHDLLLGEIPPQGQDARNVHAPLPTADDLFDALDRLRRPGEEK